MLPRTSSNEVSSGFSNRARRAENDPPEPTGEQGGVNMRLFKRRVGMATEEVMGKRGCASGKRRVASERHGTA